MRLILIVLASLGLAGCVNAEVEFTNDAGQTGVCSATAFGLISSAVASNEVEKCKARYLALGFLEVK